MDPVVVVGGGIVGTSVAAHLAGRSIPVTLYERDALGSGTTSDSTAVFVFHQSDPDPVQHRLRVRSWETYGPLADLGRIDFERIGGLDVALTAAELDPLRAAGAKLREYGVAAEMLDPADLAPFGLDPDLVAGALYTPEDGYLDPGGIVQQFAAQARSAGARVVTGTEVTGIAVEDDRVAAVETTDGRSGASAVVNAAGPWAHRVNELVGVSLPLRHNFGQVLVLQTDSPFDLPFVQFTDGYYVRGEGRRQAFAGKYGASYEAAGVEDPDAARSVDHDYYLEVEERIGTRIPRLAGAELVDEWVGMRTLTPDRRPFVGPIGPGGYHVACGLSGLGVTLAPSIGGHVADLIEDRADPEIREYLSPQRDL